MFSAPKMDLVFIILKGEKLRQTGALCCTPDLTGNTMEETSMKKQACHIPSFTRPMAFFQNTKKNTENRNMQRMHTNTTCGVHFNKRFSQKFES